MEKALLTIYTATSIHPGAGSTTSAIDLPVQREKHNGFPVISGSSLKGSLRQQAEVAEKEKVIDVGRVNTIFGPSGDENRAAGQLLVGEAHILALPVRSLQSVFYWVTCPMILERLARDLKQLGTTIDVAALKPEPEEALVPQDLSEGDRLVLEEIDFGARTSSDLKSLLSNEILEHLPGGIGSHYTEKITQHFAVIHDDNFALLASMGTQVSARIVLNDNSKISENLWYEETLPSETIFWSLLLVRDINNQNGEDSALTDLRKASGDEGLLQVGGNETVGQGWCYTKISNGEGSK